MMWNRGWIAVPMLCALLLVAANALAAPPLPATSKALADVETWLRGSPNAQGWRDFLRLDELKAEAAQGNQARPPILAGILEPLSGGAPGTDSPKFQALRRAILDDLAQLPGGAATAVRSVKAIFKPITEADVIAARKKLQASTLRADAYLGKTANGLAWKTYLRWDDLQRQLAAGNEADPEALYELTNLYSNGHAGLEHPSVMATAQDLRNYAEVLTVFKNPQASIQHGQRIEQMAAIVEAAEKNPAAADIGSLAAMLGETQAAHQSTELVAAIRNRFSQPNLFVNVHRRFLAAGMESQINEIAPITDNIMGTRIGGTTHTTANVFLTMRPNATKALFDMHLVGSVSSNTVGHNGPAIIYSRGLTSIDGHKVIEIDGDGLKQYAATAAARTSTQFTGFSSTAKCLNGLITKVASKRANQSKGQAEYVAARHAKDRIRNRMNEQSAQLVAQANADWRTKFRAPLDRWNVFPQRLEFSTDAETLNLLALSADQYQLGAIVPPPPFTGGDRNSDIEFRLHETFANNVTETMLAGRTLTKAYVEQTLMKVANEVPEELQDEEQRDWSITLDSVKPFGVSFHDGGFDVIIRGTEYTSGDNTYPAMNVSAKYKFEKSDGIVKGIRQGDVEIYPPEFKQGDQLTPQETALKRILTRRFEKILKPVMFDQGIQLKGRWAAYGKLFIRAANSEQGWLQATLAK
ncbi:MAG: hypothetical protein QM811_25225 [Pirellulales bacterium]